MIAAVVLAAGGSSRMGRPKQLIAVHGRSLIRHAVESAIDGGCDPVIVVENGRIALGGALPVNPDGGGLSSNHPGMRGIFLVIEATRQLRGECGPRQVEDAKIALVHGTGGTLGSMHSGATLLLARD